MKHYILLLLAVLLSLNLQAAFPISPNKANQPREIDFRKLVNKNTQKDHLTDRVSAKSESHHDTDNPWWGIAALGASIVGIILIFASDDSKISEAILPTGILLNIMAIVFGAIGLKKEMYGLAIAGMVLGIAVTAIALFAIVAVYIAFGGFR